MWDRFSRPSLARNSGRMSSIDAPVVPSRFAMTAPTPRKVQFTAGVPRIVPFRRIPPEIVNRLPNRTRKETYSSAVRHSSPGAAIRNQAATGSPKARLTFPKCLAQNREANSGNRAMERRRPANGRTDKRGRAWPRA